MSCPGPCIICGDTNYPLSMGGSSICPSCDCGIDPEVARLRREVAMLRTELAKYDPAERERIRLEVNEMLHPRRPIRGKITGS